MARGDRREGLRIDPRLAIPDSELGIETSRAGGPGGQNVNKLETRVRLRFSLRTSRALSEGQRAWLLERLGPRLNREGELLVDASRHRTQGRNLEDARERLASLIRDALVRPKARRATRPSRASRERRLGEKKRRSEIKRGRAGSGD